MACIGLLAPGGTRCAGGRVCLVDESAGFAIDTRFLPNGGLVLARGASRARVGLRCAVRLGSIGACALSCHAFRAGGHPRCVRKLTRAAVCAHKLSLGINRFPFLARSAGILLRGAPDFGLIAVVASRAPSARQRACARGKLCRGTVSAGGVSVSGLGLRLTLGAQFACGVNLVARCA